MPPMNPKTIITTLSTIYLLALSILAALALHKSYTLSLPTPNILAALAIALPPLAGLALETTTTLITRAREQEDQDQTSNSNKPTSTLATTTRRTKHQNPRMTLPRATLIHHLTLAVLLVSETALLTLASTYIAHPSVCELREAWQDMWRAKDAAGIRAVQEALRCCGFASPVDMSWPFRGGCAASLGFDRGCLEGWRGQERGVGGLLVGVAVGVFVWEIMLLAVPSAGGRAWLPSGVRLPDEEGRRHRRIEYRDAEDANEEDSLADEVRRLNSDSQLASTVEGGRARRSVLLNQENQENEWTSNANAA